MNSGETRKRARSVKWNGAAARAHVWFPPR